MMEQVITAIEGTKGSKKRKIHVNDAWVFSLYPSQVQKHGLVEGMELTKELYQEICGETLLPQAKRRTLNLLVAKDRSQKELLEKLTGDGYPKEVAEAALEYAKGYHYVDDLRFALTYLRSHAEEKSGQQLRMKLKEKGIGREVVDEAFEAFHEERIEQMGDAFEEAEHTALRKQICRKVKNPADLAPKDIQKLFASLYAKGFSGADIRKVFQTCFLGDVPEDDIG